MADPTETTETTPRASTPPASPANLQYSLVGRRFTTECSRDRWGHGMLVASSSRRLRKRSSAATIVRRVSHRRAPDSSSSRHVGS